MSSKEESYTKHAKGLEKIIKEWVDLTRRSDLDNNTITNITEKVNPTISQIEESLIGVCENADLESAKKSLEGQRNGVVSRLLSFFKTSSPEMASRMTDALYQMVLSKHELALAAKAKLTANLNSPFKSSMAQGNQVYGLPSNLPLELEPGNSTTAETTEQMQINFLMKQLGCSFHLRPLP